MEHLVESLMLIGVLAVVLVGAVSWFAGRIGVATPLVLTVIGIGLAFIPGAEKVVIEPEIILTVVLPPLLYAAALKVPIVDFRRNLRVISFLAVVLVVLSAFAVAGLVAWIWPAVGFALALALGAVVAPPDAVAATSLGKQLGLPPRIVTILEGEGLINDATALVLLSTALAVASGGAEVSAGGVVGSFLVSVVGAVVIGFAVGKIAVVVRSKLDDVVLDTALSVVVPFVAFMAAEHLGVSGVVAVVVAGIVVGNAGRSKFGARSRQSENTTWGTFSMIVENAIFLYMGLRLPSTIGSVIESEQSTQQVVAVGLAVTVLLVAVRFAAMPVLLLIIRRRLRRLERDQQLGSSRIHQAEERFADVDDSRIASRLDQFRRRVERTGHDVTAEYDQKLGWRDGAVIGWAGMRGVVTVAAVQTLPAEHPWYSALVLVAFVVALATLLVQGLSLPALVRGLHLQQDHSEDERHEFVELVHLVRSRGHAALEGELDKLPTLSDAVRAELTSMNEVRRVRAENYAKADLNSVEDEVAQFLKLRQVEMSAIKKALDKERASGSFSSEAFARVQAQLDIDELQLEALRGVRD